MLRQIFALLAIFTFSCSTFCGAQSSEPKKVDVKIEGLFSFDPLSGWYIDESLESVSTYIKSWREETPDLRFCIYDSLRWGYAHYLSEVDTTLLPRVLEYLDAERVDLKDTLAVGSLRYKDLSLFSKDREFEEYFNSDIQAIKRYYATPVAQFDTVLKYNPFDGGNFENLFHSFQSEVSGAELSVFSPSRLTASLPKECYVKDLVSVLYYDNDLVVVEMSGKELKEYMEAAYSRKYYRVRDESDDLLKYKTPAFLFTSLGGVPHTVNLTKSAGKVIENWGLTDDRIYSVAINSFLARDMKVVRVCGDYKTLMLRWLKTTENFFKIKVEADLQPQRIVENIAKREQVSVLGEY